MTTERFWQPPDFNSPESGKLAETKALFSKLYPLNEYGDLAARISQYWIFKLKEIWTDKPDSIKRKDLKLATKEDEDRYWLEVFKRA